MFARDWMDRCRSLSLSGVEPLPAGLKLLTAATTDSNNSRSEKATIDAFKENIWIIAGHKIHDAVIWKFAHYKSDTQWKRRKSGRLDLASSAARTFSQILAMPPVEFVEELKKQQSKTSLEKFF
jgi:hypothetical protein